MADATHLAPPPLDIEGYLESIDRCRAKYPTLKIITGVELGEPHWFAEQSRQLLGTGGRRRSRTVGES